MELQCTKLLGHPVSAFLNIISINVEINGKCCTVRRMDSTAIVTALDALAHEHRLAVFRQLVQAGPEGLTAGTLSSRLEVSPSSLSFHLKDLVQADLIQPRHAGRQIFYSPRFETMNGLIGYLTENCCGGNPCSAVCANAGAADGASS
jgi:ArsR family transcriptional regulator